MPQSGLTAALAWLAQEPLAGAGPLKRIWDPNLRPGRSGQSEDDPRKAVLTVVVRVCAPGRDLRPWQGHRKGGDRCR